MSDQPFTTAGPPDYAEFFKRQLRLGTEDVRRERDEALAECERLRAELDEALRESEQNYDDADYARTIAAAGMVEHDRLRKIIRRLWRRRAALGEADDE